jgi:hypothetical protein
LTVEPIKLFDAIVFDLGGVFIELCGVARVLELLDHRITVDELWTRWLASRSVREFETGRMETDHFAAVLLAEFELASAPAAFLAECMAGTRACIPASLETSFTLLA